MPSRVARFAEFELDSGRYELRRGDRVLKLEKIPMELLMLLAESNGQLVTRDQIIERIWGEGVFLDTEHGINTAIRKIRQALGDDSEQPRFVQTVTGKGYRFIAPAIALGERSTALSQCRKKTAHSYRKTGCLCLKCAVSPTASTWSASSRAAAGPMLAAFYLLVPSRICRMFWQSISYSARSGRGCNDSIRRCISLPETGTNTTWIAIKTASA